MKRTLCVLAATLVIILSFSSSCATMDDEMKPWLGRQKQEIIREWGPPHHVEPGENGGTVMYWSRLSGHRTERIWFYANKDGKLYYYRWQTRG